MAQSIQHIGIIGSGNVAWHLSRHLSDRGLNIEWIYSRNATSGRELAAYAGSTYSESLPDRAVDLILLCVNDDAIQSVLGSIPSSIPVAYTSGTKPLEDLHFSGENLGVFYPLQTFSKEREIDLFDVPFFIEGRNTAFAQDLFDLAWKLSRKVKFANSAQRAELHLAAVIVNNFSNHLFYLAQQYLNSKELDWNDLRPLISETVAKLNQLDPYHAQTGPARRGDRETIQRQLDQLSSPLKELYAALTKSIEDTYSS